MQLVTQLIAQVHIHVLICAPHLHAFHVGVCAALLVRRAYVFGVCFTPGGVRALLCLLVAKQCANSPTPWCITPAHGVLSADSKVQLLAYAGAFSCAVCVFTMFWLLFNLY